MNTSRLHSGWYWVALACVTVAMIAYARYHDLAGLYAGYRYSEDELGLLEERRDALDAEHRTLQQNVKDLDNDPLAVEAEIRRSKGLVREGETIYRVEIPPAPQGLQEKS